MCWVWLSDALSGESMENETHDSNTSASTGATVPNGYTCAAPMVAAVAAPKGEAGQIKTKSSIGQVWAGVQGRQAVPLPLGSGVGVANANELAACEAALLLALRDSKGTNSFLGAFGRLNMMLEQILTAGMGGSCATDIDELEERLRALEVAARNSGLQGLGDGFRGFLEWCGVRGFALDGDSTKVATGAVLEAGDLVAVREQGKVCVPSQRIPSHSIPILPTCTPPHLV